MNSAISRRRHLITDRGFGATTGREKLKLVLCAVGIGLSALACVALAAMFASSVLNWAA